MRRFILGVWPFVGLLLAAACETGSSTGPNLGPQNIHPQPQPNSDQQRFSAPCTGTTCGTAPSTLASPVCKPEAAGCSWAESTSTSYRPCAESECGVAPGPEVCPTGTTFVGNTCGSENEAACSWSTGCKLPRSTTPCPTADGCGPMPLIGVVCKDGSNGELACMQLPSRCAWQPTCD